MLPSDEQALRLNVNLDIVSTVLWQCSLECQCTFCFRNIQRNGLQELRFSLKPILEFVAILKSLLSEQLVRPSSNEPLKICRTLEETIFWKKCENCWCICCFCSGFVFHMYTLLF